jgi:fatty acid desaturase
MTIEELRKLVESKRNPVVVNRGVTPLSLLGVAFIILKLIGYINWSWWWVLAPFWIPVCLALLLFGIIGIIIMIIAK